MLRKKSKQLFILTITFALALTTLTAAPPTYKYINGFSKEVNYKIEKTLQKYVSYDGRKIATFDMDGTVIGQVPYYLADEALYEFALDHPDRKPNLIKEMSHSSNTSKKYVAQRVDFFAGLSPEEIVNIGNKTYDKYYKNKFFPNIKDLIENLKNFGFEVWVVSASPEFLYQGFIAKQLGIPVTNVIGIKSVVKNNKTTVEIVPPVAQMDGKPSAIETFVKGTPLIAAGNSKDDFEMLESSKDLKIIVNPDNTEKVSKLDNLTLEEYAKKNNWLIVRANDTIDQDIDKMACKKFNIRQNTVNKVD